MEEQEFNKLKEDAITYQNLKDYLSNLEETVSEMRHKRGKNFTSWLKTQNQYLEWEKNFDPTKLRDYKRGDIVLANLGFNIGSEYGGLHYAIVMDKNNRKNNPLVNVVPLSSLNEEQTESDIHRDEVYLGQTSINNKKSVAIINQFRPISKLRIYKPKNQAQEIHKLSSDNLDKIDYGLKRMFIRD